MEDARVTVVKLRLYEPSPIPCLNCDVAPAEDMVGRVPLILLFLAGNATLTIPHVYSTLKDPGLPGPSGLH